jgi:long-chain acyl-CoA synthetase
MSEVLKLIHAIEGKPYYKIREIESLKDMILQLNNMYPDHTAFQFRKTPQSDVIKKSFSEACQDMDALGTALMSLKLGGCKIAIIGENRYEWAISFLTTVNGVGIVVPLDKMLPPNEIERMLERGEVDAIVYSQAFHDTIVDISHRRPGLKACICMNPEDEDGFSEFTRENPAFFSFNQLLNIGYKLIENGSKDYTDIIIDPKAMRILLFTSGTSATSKAVMLSHENVCSDIMGLAGIVRFEPGDSVLSILPLHHTFENTAGLLFPMYLGMTVSISDGLKYLSKNLVEYKPVCIVGVPLIFEKFMHRINEEIKKKGMTKKVRTVMGVANVLRYTGLDLRRKLFKQLLASLGGKLKVIVTGGAAMDNKTAKFYESIGVRVYQGYGLTETSPVAAGCNDRRRKIGTCGDPLPGVTLAISNPDEDGSGEIVIKGKTVMLGYWKDEESTRESIVDGWFRTGDLGRISKSGLIHVTGRVKSMIVLKNGKKVFPEEIEALINKLDYVKESFVWGERMHNGDVEICAKIVIDEESLQALGPCNEEEIRNLLDKAIKEINSQVPVYKKVRYYVFGFSELVKTTTLKVKRYIEINQIHEILKGLTTTVKNTCGRNIDKLREMLQEGLTN